MRVAQIPGRQARIGSREMSTGSRGSDNKKLLCNRQSKLKGQGSKISTGEAKRRKSDGQQTISSVAAAQNRNMMDLSEAHHEYNEDALNDVEAIQNVK